MSADHCQLGGVRLRGCHRPLLTGEEVDDDIGTRSKWGVGLIGDGDRGSTLVPTLLEDRHDVGRLTTLGDPDHQGSVRRGGRSYPRTTTVW